jgi:hypothetical protein
MFRCSFCAFFILLLLYWRENNWIYDWKSAPKSISLNERFIEFLIIENWIWKARIADFGTFWQLCITFICKIQYAFEYIDFWPKIYLIPSQVKLSSGISIFELKPSWQYVRQRGIKKSVNIGNCQILALFDNSALRLFAKYNNFLLICSFLTKNISNYISFSWKLDNQFCFCDDHV